MAHLSLPQVSTTRTVMVLVMVRAAITASKFLVIAHPTFEAEAQRFPSLLEARLFQELCRHLRYRTVLGIHLEIEVLHFLVGELTRQFDQGLP